MMMLDDERWKLSSDNYNVVVCFVGSGTFTYLLFFYIICFIYKNAYTGIYVQYIVCLDVSVDVFFYSAIFIIFISSPVNELLITCLIQYNVAYIVPDSNMSSNAQKHFSP